MVYLLQAPLVSKQYCTLPDCFKCLNGDKQAGFIGVHWEGGAECSNRSLLQIILMTNAWVGGSLYSRRFRQMLLLPLGKEKRTHPG